MNLTANALGFKTFRWIGANETTLLLPGDPLPVSEHALPPCDPHFLGDMALGLAPELVAQNLEAPTHYARIETQPGEVQTLPMRLYQAETPETGMFETLDLHLAPDSALSLTLWHEGLSPASSTQPERIRHSLIRVKAEKGARLHLNLVQVDDCRHHSLESVALAIEAGAEVVLHQFHLGGKQVASNVRTDLLGEEAKLHIDAVYYGTRESQLDFLYETRHFGAQSQSEVGIRGVLDDEATKSLKATLDFREGAKAAKGSEEERVILLSDHCHATAVPVLLAHEDDVEGAHAASAGKIDPDQLFYIMSRGYDEAAAKQLMIEALFHQALSDLHDDALQARIWSIIETHLAQGGPTCH